MKLITHLQQGSLLFLKEQGFRLTIEENQYFRWMSFDNVPQSIMHLRHPCWLTLPHHVFLILPLTFFKPRNIVEVGLGGGNLSRFLCSKIPDAHVTSWESNEYVIDCFERYFNPTPLINHKCIQQCATAELITAEQKIDWIIYDVFSANDSTGIDLHLAVSLLNSIPKSAWLTLNLPNLAPNQLDLVLRELKKHVGHKHFYYFFVPNYKNIIVHIGFNANNTKVATLPTRTLKRLKALWKHACLDRQLKSDRAIVK